MQDLQAKTEDYQNKLAQFNDLIAAQVTRVHNIDTMNTLSKDLNWDKDKQAHLDKTLKALNFDGKDNVTNSQIIHTWQNILARRNSSAIFEQEASHKGPNAPGAGTQSFEDCTLFALANAANLPYSVVAARAAKLISEEKWRSKDEHDDPQDVLEKHGLNGYEMGMLAEAFGQPEVVSMSDFPKVLKDGSPIILDVVSQGGLRDGPHEVVLTKAFEHNGETWYEMMDSNQGPQKRLYLSANELGDILQEKCIAFHPDSGTTPKLL